MWGGDILFEDGKLRLEARLDLLEMTDVYLRKSSALLKHNRIVKNVVPSCPFFLDDHSLHFTVKQASPSSPLVLLSFFHHRHPRLCLS